MATYGADMRDQDDVLTTDDLLAMLAETFTEGMRAYALNAGWPQHIAQTLSVVVTEFGKLEVQSPYGQDALDDLEYGVPGQAPMSVIGNYLHSSKAMQKGGDRIVREITNLLVKHAAEAMELT